MIHRVHSSERMSCVIEKMIGNMVIMVMMTHKDKIEIGQDEESREEEPCAPERVRNPVIQVVIVLRRRIIGDNRRTFIIVIRVDC